MAWGAPLVRGGRLNRSHFRARVIVISRARDVTHFRARDFDSRTRDFIPARAIFARDHRADLQGNRAKRQRTAS